MTSPMCLTIGQITPIKCQCGGQFRDFTPAPLGKGYENGLRELTCMRCGKCVGLYDGVIYHDKNIMGEIKAFEESKMMANAMTDIFDYMNKRK